MLAAGFLYELKKMQESQTRDRRNSGRRSYEVGAAESNEVGEVGEVEEVGGVDGEESLGTQEESLPGVIVNCEGKRQSSGCSPEEMGAAYRAGPRFISTLVFDCDHHAGSYGQIGFPLEVASHIVEFTTARSAASQNQKNRQEAEIPLTERRRRERSN